MGNGSHSRLVNGHKSLENLDFAGYNEACREDEDVQRIDHNLKARMGKVMTALDMGANEQSFSVDSLREVTTALLAADLDVMDVIVEYREDVWKHRDLFLLVEEFFECSQATLEFCTEVQSSITSAKANQSLLQMGLNLVPADREPDEHAMKRILHVLEKFCQAKAPFGDTFTETFQAVQERHKSMLLKLLAKKSRLDRKLKHVVAWSKVSSILFGAAVAAVLICAIVAAAIAAPPVAGALAAASSLPLGSMGAWLGSMWKKYEDKIRDQRNAIEVMRAGTRFTIVHLDNIKRLTVHLEIQLKAIVDDLQILRRDVSALKISVEDITSKMSSFVKELDDLQKHVDRVGSRIDRARRSVSEIIAPRRDATRTS